MIFVTVGTHYLGFERLIKKIDEIAGRIDEEIIAQIGLTSYKPKNVKYFTFINEEGKILDFYKKSRIVVTHSGAGTILNLLQYKKPIVVVPRLKKFNECIDNHQLELTEVIGNKGLATVVYNIEELEFALNNLNIKKIEFDKNNGDLINYLKKYIEDFKT
jgi:UDP-N-acetylglucosamine transferase subunit ALG13